MNDRHDSTNDRKFEIARNHHLGNQSGVRSEVLLQIFLHLLGEDRRPYEKRKKDPGSKPNRRVQEADASKKPDHVATLGQQVSSVESPGGATESDGQFWESQ